MNSKVAMLADLSDGTYRSIGILIFLTIAALVSYFRKHGAPKTPDYAASTQEVFDYCFALGRTAANSCSDAEVAKAINTDRVPTVKELEQFLTSFSEPHLKRFKLSQEYQNLAEHKHTSAEQWEKNWNEGFRKAIQSKLQTIIREKTRQNRPAFKV